MKCPAFEVYRTFTELVSPLAGLQCGDTSSWYILFAATVCRWAFLFADGAVLAWEQGMVGAERAGPATSAAQSCLRFEHPTMMDELAVVANVEGMCPDGI